MKSVRSVALHVALGLLAAAAGVAFAPAFGGRFVSGDFAPGALVAGAVAGALVPAVVVAAARWFDLEAVLVAAIGLVAAAAAVALVTRPGTAVFSGAYRLLTSALPANADGPACATVAGLAGLASLTGSLIAAFARQRALSVVPALVVLGAALALDAGIRQPPVWYAAVVLVLLGAALALAREPVRHSEAVPPNRSARIARRAFPLAGAAAILAAGALLATSFAQDLPAVGHRAADARNLVPPPLKPRTAVNPMAHFPAMADGTERVQLTGTASRRLPQLTYVTLDSFTGQTWTTGADFRRAGRTLSDTAGAGSVRLDIRAQRTGPLVWLVRPDRPTSLDRDGLGIDETTGDLVIPGGVAYPKRYRITGAAPLTDDDVSADDTAVPLRGPVSSGDAAVPTSLRRFAEVTRGSRNDKVRMSGLANLLQNGDGYYVDDSPDAPGGNGYFRLDEVIGAKVKHIGTSEQYASAFAVMARYLGYQARLVVGFVPRYARSTTGSGVRFSITGRDIKAWAQVRFASAGWVTYDPTPTRPSSQAKPRRNPAGANATPSRSSSAPRTSTPPTPPVTTPRAETDRRPAGSNLGTVLLVAAVAVVILVLLSPPGLKAARRRRRRGAAVPAHAVYGAWREATDRLTEAGAPPQRGRSTSEVARDAPEAARTDVHALGGLVDRAGYAPGPASDSEARAAWGYADSARRALRERLPWWRRVLAALDPRPLWRR